MSLKEIARAWLPPVVVEAVRRLRSGSARPDWEYCPDGWRTRDSNITGWNVESVVETQQQVWPEFVRLVEGTGPLGINHTDFHPDNTNLGAHNTILSFGYVLALAARGRDRLSLLDWGGGLGQYCVLARALLPDVPIDYFCRDVPLLCAGGREVLPDAVFYETDDACRERRYDLVFASGSIQYAEAWRDTLGLLAELTGSYLYLTRVPVVHQAESFVVVQRPYACGYRTEYLGWFFNRGEFLAAASELGLELQREFLTVDRHPIHGAPEQGEYRGFLFRPAAR